MSETGLKSETGCKTLVERVRQVQREYKTGLESEMDLESETGSHRKFLEAAVFRLKLRAKVFLLTAEDLITVDSHLKKPHPLP